MDFSAELRKTYYLPFIYGYGMKTFGILSALLVIQGTLSFYLFPGMFSLSAFVTGGILILFALIHYRQVKKEI